MRIFLIVMLWFGSSQLVFSADKLTMGMVPQQSPLKLFKAWKPITDYLSEKTGKQIVFKTEKSIAELEKVLYASGYDMAYMNPYHFVVYTTDAYPSHPIAFKPDMDKVSQKILAAALLEIPDELTDRLNIKKFISVKNEEYETVKVLEEKLSIVER